MKLRLRYYYYYYYYYEIYYCYYHNTSRCICHFSCHGNLTMVDDVEQVLETPEQKAPSPIKSSIWEKIYFYQMPNLTTEQLNGFSKYKVSSDSFHYSSCQFS